MSHQSPEAPLIMLTQEQVEEWGERIGREAGLPLVVALRGTLGAGKSTLARAIARGAGVTGSVPSPTYNLHLAYRGSRASVHHLDLFRIQDPAEVWELGWDDLGTEAELVLIEWPERVESLLPPDRWDVSLTDIGEPRLRAVTMEPVGSPPSLPPPPSTSRSR